MKKYTALKYFAVFMAVLTLCQLFGACRNTGDEKVTDDSKTAEDTGDTRGVTDSVSDATPTEPVGDVDTDGDDVGSETSATEVRDYSTLTDLVLPEFAYDSGKGDAVPAGILASSRDVFADTWNATDGVGRSMPLTAETRTPTDGTVGIFYFLWRDQNNLNPIPPSDHFKAWQEGGVDKLWQVMQEGGEGHPHYWAEPYFGYYSSNDEWVLRRHAYMFADAGIDFVFFDTTNNNLHTVSHMALLKVWEEVRQEGYQVPKICFLVGDYDGEFHQLYNTIYKKNLYSDLWFYWNGKPVVMTSGTSIRFTDEEKEFFTWRLSWADTSQNWYQVRRGVSCWPWSANYSPAYGKDEEGNKEQIIVMVAGGGQSGRSLLRNRYPAFEGDWDFGYAILETGTPYGRYFSQFFDYALKCDPRLIMITGWNEWIAGRWSGAGAGAGAVGMKFANEYWVTNDPNSLQQTYFVDEFNPEFSRDAEPMKGGFGDNYYYQMAEYIRKYKGSRAQEAAFGQVSVDLNGDVTQWYQVGPEYRDYSGDTTERCAPGHVGGNQYGMYVNYSGRNDIVTAKISSDDKYLYFYVECADTITSPTGTNWMNLFIDSDCDGTTGWHGYEYLLNREQRDGYVSVERFVGTDTWAFETVGCAEYVLNGRYLILKAEKTLLGFEGSFDFKWADNSIPTHDVMEFLDQGDAAPNGRFSYHFTLTQTDEKVPGCLTSDMLVFKNNSYYAYVGGQNVMLVPDNTLGVLKASGQSLWLPKAFLEKYGFAVENTETVSHYGMEYVYANDILTAGGRQLTFYEGGMVVVSEQPVTDVNVLTTLYRCLK